MSVLDEPLVFVDIETTGMSYSRSRIIEVAAIRVENNEITKSFTSLVDPEVRLPEFISSLTGITDRDLDSAPTFYDIADELHDIMAQAIFVAHNVRFDYGFLKQEFKRASRQFNPKLLCTVKLSKALYPGVRGHKLQDLINRCDIQVKARHRAYDDAQVMWHFLQHAQRVFPAPQIENAIAQQVKSPSLPNNLSPELIRNLPEGPGVYIFWDDKHLPLYIGKSVTIKKRVQSHFSSDHSVESEFKISQQIADIEARPTTGELEALLLESQLVKELQPLFNRQLRRRQKLTLASQIINNDGYATLGTAEAETIDPSNLSDILGVYTSKGKARIFLNQITKDFGLCPKLMGLEKGSGSCFYYQLKKCSGACIGKELAKDYNNRLWLAFERCRLHQWPYSSPIVIEETPFNETYGAIVVDQWCVIANIKQEPECEPVIKFHNKMFDLDTYKILRSHLTSKARNLIIRPISHEQLNSLSA